MKRYLSLCLAVLLVLALMPTMALAVTEKVGTEEELAEAIQNAKNGAIDTIKLEKNFKVRVNGVATHGGKFIIPNGVTIDGNNKTITVERSVEGSADASLFLVSGEGSSATIKNLTINGAGKIKHGMQAYGGATLAVEKVEVHNCTGYALVVNGSKVTVKGLTTSGNEWGGINVDLGVNVTTPATLNLENATIAEPTSVKVEHSHSDEVEVTANIYGGSFQSVEISAKQTTDTTLTVSGGEFTTLPKEYVAAGQTAARLDGKTYVGSADLVAQKLAGAQSGQTITVLTGNLDLTGVPAGVRVENQGSGNVTVNGVSVVPNESNTKPTKPIAGVVIGGGNQQEDEDEPEQSPSNTLRYAVICRTLNVRSGPGTEYSKLGTLSRGTLLDGELLSNGWVKFSYNGQTAYVSGMYVQSVDNGQLSVQCGTLNVRSGAGTSYSKIGALYRGTYVKPLETQGNWYKIGYDGGYGWICADYVG